MKTETTSSDPGRDIPDATRPIDVDALAARRADIAARYVQPIDDRHPSTTRGIHHVALLSSDVERTVQFYQGVLGGVASDRQHEVELLCELREERFVLLVRERVRVFADVCAAVGQHQTRGESARRGTYHILCTCASASCRYASACSSSSQNASRRRNRTYDARAQSSTFAGSLPRRPQMPERRLARGESSARQGLSGALYANVGDAGVMTGDDFGETSSPRAPRDGGDGELPRERETSS